MNPVLTQWLPVIVMLLAIWFGLLYNNKRLDDFKDLLGAQVGKAKSELRLEISQSEKKILDAIADLKADLKADIQSLDRRVERLEEPRLRTS